MTNQNLSQLRVVDPVLTTVVHGYCQTDSVAPFVAPVVPVNVRAGKIIKFTKEHFAVVDTRRSPGATIQRVSTNYTSEDYLVQQHAVAAEVNIESYEEAENGEAQVNLREQAALRAAAAIAQSWEKEVLDLVTNPAIYEPDNVITANPTDRWNDPGADPERLIQTIQEVIRSQIGCYANSLLLSPSLFNAVRLLPIFRDRIKYTSSASVNLDMLSTWFDLPGGVKVANRVFLHSDGTLKDFMPAGSAVLFFSPHNGPSSENHAGYVFQPAEGANRSTPSAFYTYQLAGYPVAGQERVDPDRRVVITDVVAEQSIQPVGLGATGKVGAAALITGLLG